MPVFISHSRNTPEDEDALENIISALDQAKPRVEHWTDRGRLTVGLGLREQIRRGLRTCEVCLFVATPTSLASPWCLLEVGAFWGAGKPVVCFLANGATRTTLPAGLGAALSSGSVAKVVADLRRLLPTQDGRRTVVEAEFAFDLQVGQLRSVVQQAMGVYEENHRRSALGVLMMARGLPGPEQRAPAALLGGSISLLVGLPFETLQEALNALFPINFEACREATMLFGRATRVDGSDIAQCLLFRCQEGEVRAVAFADVVATGSDVALTVRDEASTEVPPRDGWEVTLTASEGR